MPANNILTAKTLTALAASFGKDSTAYHAIVSAAQVSTYFAGQCNAYIEKGGIFEVISSLGTYAQDTRAIIVAKSWLPADTGREGATNSQSIDFVLVLAHEIGHAISEGGYGNLLPGIGPAIAVQNLRINEGVALTSEYIVAKQLNAPMHSDSGQSHPINSLKDQLDALATESSFSIEEATFGSKAVQQFIAPDSRAVAVSGLWNGTSNPSVAPQLTYDEYAADWYILSQCEAVSGHEKTNPALVDWTSVPPGTLTFAAQANGQCTFESTGIKLKDGNSMSISGTLNSSGAPAAISTATRDTTGQLLGSLETICTSNGQLKSQKSFDGAGNLICTTNGSMYVDGMLSEANVYDASGKRTNVLIYDMATATVKENRLFDPATGQQRSTTLYKDGQPYAAADFANGKQLNYQVIDSITGLVVEKREFDLSTGKVASIKYYVDGQQTAENRYNAQGVRTNYIVTNPSTGAVTEDRQFNDVNGNHFRTLYYTDGQLVAIANVANGKQLDYQYIDDRGRISAQSLYNDKGVRTNYQVFNLDNGQMIEDRQFDGSTGMQFRNVLYSDGKPVAILNIVNGRRVDYQYLDEQGKITAQNLYIDETGRVYAQNLFNDRGVRTNYQILEAAGTAVVEDRQFDAVTGAQIRNVYYASGNATQISYFSNGRETERQFIDESGRMSARNLYNENGVRTNYQVINPANGTISQDRQFDGMTGAQLRNVDYVDGRKVSEADFAGGKQTTFRRYDPATGACTQEDRYNPSTGNLASRSTFTDGHCAIARYDDNVNWIDTEVHATLDPSSSVISRYWVKDGQLHHWWTDGAGHDGESMYRGTTSSSGLLRSEFTDQDGWHHVQTYNGAQGTDVVTNAQGSFMYKAIDSVDHTKVGIFYPAGNVATISGHVSDAASYAASRVSASGIVSPIVPYVPIVLPNSASTPTGSGSYLIIDVNSYGYVVNTPSPAGTFDILVIGTSTSSDPLQSTRMLTPNNMETQTAEAIPSSELTSLKPEPDQQTTQSDRALAAVENLIAAMAASVDGAAATMVHQQQDTNFDTRLAVAVC